MSLPGGLNKARKVVLTVAVTAVTCVGALYGAGLKTRKEMSEAKHVVAEIPVSERIAALQQSRVHLTRQQDAVTAKLAELGGRIAEKKKAEDEKNAGKAAAAAAAAAANIKEAGGAGG